MAVTSAARSRFNRKLLAASIVIIVAATVAVAWQVYLNPKHENTNQVSPNSSLTIVGADGQQKDLNFSQVVTLGSYTSSGGYITEAGNVTFGNYTGVPMVTLLNLVGGLKNGENITAIGSDGYHVTFTYQQVQGQGLETYDPTTLLPVEPSQPLTMIVAYYCNGTNLPSGQGPFSIAIVGSQGLITPGVYWTYLLDKIEITA